MQKRIIFFDYDGVLVDSLAVALECLNRTLRKFGIAESMTADEVATFPEVLFSAFAEVKGVDERRMPEFLAAFFSNLAAHSDRIRLFPGIRELLVRLRRSHEMLVLSGSPAPAIRRVLEREGVADCVTGILGADIPGNKASKIAQTLGGPNSAALMVGDSGSDMRAARRAGIDSVAVTWGWQTPEVLARENPKITVQSVGELAELLSSTSSAVL